MPALTRPMPYAVATMGDVTDCHEPRGWVVLDLDNIAVSPVQPTYSRASSLASIGNGAMGCECYRVVPVY